MPLLPSLSSPVSSSKSPAMLNLVILIFFFSLHHTTSLSPNATLSGCLNTFSCGTLRNISYPFTGGDRPSYCGPPQFHLSCRGDSPELNISPLSYRVLQLEPDEKVLTLARSDFWFETCTHEFVNSSFDLNIFNFSSGTEVLNLMYGCMATTLIWPIPNNRFYCDFNGTRTDSYSLIGPVPRDPSLDVIKCYTSVQVPIFESEANRLKENRSLLGEVLMKGFNMSYTSPYDNECAECLGLGGQCGFDSDFGISICICGDKLCPEQAEPGNSSKGKIIGIIVGVVGLFGILLGSLLFLVLRRRKRIAEESKSKEFFVPPSSGGGNTSTTNMSQSVPSYATSNVESVQKSFYYGVQVFTYAELEEATDNFNPSKELGDGGFGTVYYGKLKDGRIVAVKRLYESNFKRVEQFMNEVQILAKIRHENLVALYGCTSRHSRELLLVYEYIPNGTVADHVHGRRAKSVILPWPIRLNIAVETAQALAYLHASDVIHRDVKTNNILLDNNFRVKVADFGLSRLFPTHVTHVSTAPQGTPGYVDPEYYQCYQLTDKSDVYSFGVVLIELISSLEAVDVNRTRLDVNLANMAINKIQNHELEELVGPFLGFERDPAIRMMITSVAELAFRCLQQERDLRPSMDEVLNVLKGIRDEEYGQQDSEVVDIRRDEVIPLKNVPLPFSPDSVADNWVSRSTTSNSS